MNRTRLRGHRGATTDSAPRRWARVRRARARNQARALAVAWQSGPELVGRREVLAVGVPAGAVHLDVEQRRDVLDGVDDVSGACLGQLVPSVRKRNS